MRSRTQTLCTVWLGMALSLVSLAGCAHGEEQNLVSEQQVGEVTQSMTDEAADQMEAEVSAFEITATQREQAKDNEDYIEIARRMNELFDEYYEEYEAATQLADAA